MRKELKLSTAVLAAALFIGCDSKKEETTPVVTPPAPKADTGLPTVNTEAMKDAANNAGQAMKDTATNAGQAMKDAGAAATDKAKDTMAAAKDQVGTADTQAQGKIAEITQYIKENKYDLADKALTEVEGMKDKLSPTLQTTVSGLRTQLNGLKAGGGMTMPTMPGMGK